MKRNSVKAISAGAVIAALYVVLTLVSAALGLSSGPIQLRFSEALCILPCFLKPAIPGLFIGCITSNLLTGGTAMDIVFGSLATLIGAAGTYCFRKNKFHAVLPPIVSNTVIVPLVLKYSYGLDGALWYFMLTVFAGEVLSTGVLGLILHSAIAKHPQILGGLLDEKKH